MNKYDKLMLGLIVVACIIVLLASSAIGYKVGFKNKLDFIRYSQSIKDGHTQDTIDESNYEIERLNTVNDTMYQLFLQCQTK